MRAILLAYLLAVGAFAGCLSHPTAILPLRDVHALTPVQDRAKEAFNVTGYYSKTLVQGAYGILPGLSVDVKVALAATSGADGATGLAATNLGLFLPKIEGCDWTAAALPPMCQVPVIADAGPYYSASQGQAALQTEGDSIATEPAHRLGQFLIQNFVPHGYAVAQVSVLGTGNSGSCQDLMGLNEQAGIDAAVTWLGTQPWSNGNVSLIGRSYDGSTPWEAATTGNPHLKTIVPISGLTGVYELMWRNGSAESRGPGLLTGIYAAMTVDGDQNDAREVLCPNYATGVPEAAGAYATGAPNDVGPHSYWGERYFLDRVLANYHGSIYAIHGLQDWNVENHMILPYYQQLQAHGLEVKGLFGQWNHMYPDRPSEHVTTPAGEGHEAYPATVRYDWAQDLLEWFDHYLKGTGPAPDLHVEVQDNHGAWRIESSYPPTDLNWVSLPFNNATATFAAVGQVPSLGAQMPWVDAAHTITLDYPALTSDTRISGLGRLPIDVIPQGPGGQLYAQLNDVAADGTSLRLGHAIMDLRFAAGGKQASPVVPGVSITAKMEFEGMEAIVPAGHHLQLFLADTGRDYLPSDTHTPVAVDLSKDSVLLLPAVPVHHGLEFMPPAWSGKADQVANNPT